MKCRQCRHPETKVLESRESKDGLTVRRRRECQNCSYRFTTFEKQEEQPVMVVKRDGSREIFDRQKVLRSMIVACQKRSVSVKDLDAVVDWIERTSGGGDEREIPASQVGELVAEALRQIDAVAYVRFVSVYRAFSGPDDFVQELKRLEEKPNHDTLPKVLSRLRNE